MRAGPMGSAACAPRRGIINDILSVVIATLRVCAPSRWARRRCSARPYLLDLSSIGILINNIKAVSDSVRDPGINTVTAHRRPQRPTLPAWRGRLRARVMFGE